MGRKEGIGVADEQRRHPSLTAEERELGIDCDITRRDFLNTVVLGTGTALLGAAAPGAARVMSAGESAARAASWHPWTGYSGVGEYSASNGNTWDVVSAGHGIRDSLYESRLAAATNTSETYDLVIVGGGFAGVIAAYTFLKETQRAGRCLILDNHPIVGGEAKRNEFIVRGRRLIGPQGSNMTFVPQEKDWSSEMWRDVGLPTEFEFGRLPARRRHMEFQLHNYGYYEDLYFASDRASQNHGYFFDTPHPHWVTNPWVNQLENTPWSTELRRELLRWVHEPMAEFAGDEQALERWLDTMTYEDYLIKVRGLHPEVARFVDPIMASGEGLGSDVLSACLAWRGYYPGFQGLLRKRDEEVRDYGVRAAVADRERRTKAVFTPDEFSFPGGNDGIMRAIVKWLNPGAIEGSTSFADIHNGRIRSEAMDCPGLPCRIRTSATAARVSQDAQRRGKPATITYLKNGVLHSVQARTVIWAAASWSGKHVIESLPAEYHAAMEAFPRSPMLCVNVALNDWRALYKLGYSTCSWRGGFGFTGNIRAPMYVGDYRPPLDPDEPTIFTSYVPFPRRGLPLLEQGKAARAQLYATSYKDFEIEIRKQMMKLFADAGFDARRDIAGIVLNRWGHAYANAGPGFYYGGDGKPAPSDVLRRPLGNLAFAHTELAGIAAWWNAGAEAVRAAKQVLSMI